MPHVIIDMTMSLDGYVAGPEDGPAFPLGKHGGRSIFDWYASGAEEYRSPLFKPAAGANLNEVKRGTSTRLRSARGESSRDRRVRRP